MMQFFLSSRHGPVTETREIPAHYQPYRIPGAQPLYVKGRFGDYLTQTIVTEGCCMQLNLFNIILKTLMFPFSAFDVIPLHFMLQGDIFCLLKGFGKAWLRNKRYNLFYVPGNDMHEARFRPGLYRSFHIDFSREYIRKPASGHAELSEVLLRLREHSFRGIQQHTAYMTPRIERMVEDTLALCPLTEPDKGFFMEAQSKLLLLKYAQDEPVETRLPADSRGAQLMQYITAYVTAHLDYYFTIPSLAEQFHISEVSFRRQFEQYTGLTFGHFLFEERMKKAHDMLGATYEHIRDIAAAVGYFDLSSFDRAFRRKFGYPPHHFRS